jgi:murein L,D-transpeptidase YcbB/YkuD
MPTAEVERFWDGAFATVWKSPVAGQLPLQLGMHGNDVAWLRRQLGALDGRAPSATASTMYDEELKQRVAAFQQGVLLTPDGIAGEETLVRLAAAAPGASGPSLDSVQP